jgi:hypothetical protein
MENDEAIIRKRRPNYDSRERVPIPQQASNPETISTYPRSRIADDLAAEWELPIG